MTDFLLVAWVSALIELRRLGWMFGLGKRWTPGEKLKLLFAGYNGTRNTGSDVRVQEMLRQIRHVLGAGNVDFSVMTQNFDRTKGYFPVPGIRHLNGPVLEMVRDSLTNDAARNREPPAQPSHPAVAGLATKVCRRIELRARDKC